MTTVLILILTQGKYGKQEIVKGLIRNESFFRVAADKRGNVAELYVKEGESVSKGASLFRLVLPWQEVADQQNGNGMMQETVRRLRETEQELLKEEQALMAENTMLTQQQTLYFSSLEESLVRLVKIEQDYQKKRSRFNKQLADYEQLLKKKAINKTEVETLKHYIIDNDVALKKVAMEKESLLQNKAEKAIYYHRLQREWQQGKDVVARKKREVVNERNKLQMQQDYIVTSPVEGVIHDVGILKGDHVDGQSPAIIVRSQERSEPLVILYLTGSQIGLISPDEKIFLRVDTFPYESYGMLVAHVVNISQTPTKVSLDQKESLFRVKLELDENDVHSTIPLAALNDGMSVTTSLRQPGQSLLAWLFMPVKKALKRNPDFL